MKSNASPLVLILAAFTSGCSVSGPFETLRVEAPKSTLRIGESIQLKVERKLSWFRTAPLEESAKPTYSTTSESLLVVEPDGKATCVGTHGQRAESAWIGALSGQSYGHLQFDLLPDGPGPTLDVAIDSPQPLPKSAQSPWKPCCSEPVGLVEGHQLQFRIRERSSGHDLTSLTTGTKYTLFFGSGVPNDGQPSIIAGGGYDVSARNVRLDADKGTLTAPESIGKLNRAEVTVFVRNGELVGWREVDIIHADGRPGGGT